METDMTETCLTVPATMGRIGLLSSWKRSRTAPAQVEAILDTPIAGEPSYPLGEPTSEGYLVYTTIRALRFLRARTNASLWSSAVARICWLERKNSFSFIVCFFASVPLATIQIAAFAQVDALHPFFIGLNVLTFAGFVHACWNLMYMMKPIPNLEAVLQYEKMSAKGYMSNLFYWTVSMRDAIASIEGKTRDPLPTILLVLRNTLLRMSDPEQAAVNAHSLLSIEDQVALYRLSNRLDKLGKLAREGGDAPVSVRLDGDTDEMLWRTAAALGVDAGAEVARLSQVNVAVL